MGKIRVKRGDVFYADLGVIMGSEQGGVRPVVIIQNEMGNKYSPTVLVAAITSKKRENRLPTHVKLSKEDGHLEKDSVILTEQMRTLDKGRLKEKITTLSDEIMSKVDKAILVEVGL